MWLMLGISVGVAVLTVLVIAGKRRVSSPPSRSPTTATAFLPALCHGPVDFIDDELPSDFLADYEELTATDTLYALDRAVGPWADAGRILIHGAIDRLGRHPETGELQLDRSGPYVPPITMPAPGVVVVTDAARQAMQDAGFTGAVFRAVHLAKIVEIPWHTWDLSAERPPYEPHGGIPESYLVNPPHCERLADMMPPLWELTAQPGATVILAPDVPPPLSSPLSAS